MGTIASGSRARPAERPPLRIVHLVSSLSVGGMEQFVLRIAAEQHRQGHQTAVIGQLGGPLLEQAADLGLDIFTLDEQGSGKAARIRTAIRHLRWLRPDVVNAHNPSSLSYALLSRLICGSRVVLVRHGQANKPVDALKWRFIDAGVGVSEAAAAVMRADNPASAQRKMSVILNGVTATPPTRNRNQVRAELGIAADAVVGIIVARVDDMKGHNTLIAAMAVLRDAGTPVTLLIAGDGAERKNLEKQARELRLTEAQVRFLGFRKDVPDLLGASDFFTLPSLSEGLPLSVLEAMASGLPVVATPVGGIPEVVEEGKHGFLIPVNDPAALAQAIGKLSQSASLRIALGEASLRRVQEQFSFAAMVEEYDALYRRLLSRASS